MLMPSIYLSLGPQEFHLETSRYSEFLRTWSARFPKPKAIIVVDALWEQPTQKVTSGAKLRILEDDPKADMAAMGLPQTLNGDIVLSLDIKSRLEAESMRAELDDQRGLDRAVWALVRLLDPSNAIPVVALSVNPSLVPEEHYRIGRALQPLREQKALILGCGTIPASPDKQRWSDWLNERILMWDIETLFDYEQRAPAQQQQPDPAASSAVAALITCMGAGDEKQNGRRVYRELDFKGQHLNAWRFD